MRSGNAAAADYFKFQAFSSAVIQDERLRLRIKAAIAGNIKRGEDQRSFLKAVKTIRAEAVNASLSAFKTIYQTNTSLAFAEGQMAALTAHRDTFPYWQYSATLDGRTRPEHAALDGKIFKVTDRAFYPPIGFNCRCTAIPMTQEDVADADLMTEDENTKTLRKNLNNTPFVGNKRAKFVQWLKSAYNDLDSPAKTLIQKAAKILLSKGQSVAQEKIIQNRKEVKKWAYKNIKGKTFKTPDGKSFVLSFSDIKIILGKSHHFRIERDLLLKNLQQHLNNAILVDTAAEKKGRKNKYKTWYYYLLDNKFVFNVALTPTGAYKLHAINNP